MFRQIRDRMNELEPAPNPNTSVLKEHLETLGRATFWYLTRLRFACLSGHEDTIARSHSKQLPSGET